MICPQNAVSVVGLEPNRLGGCHITLLGNSRRNSTPEQEAAPGLFVLAQRRSTDHQHSRGTLRIYQQARQPGLLLINLPQYPETPQYPSSFFHFNSSHFRQIKSRQKPLIFETNYTC